MLNRRETPLIFSALVALGCGGNAVDVGHSENQGWADAPADDASATTPQTIYKSEEAIFGFALDDDTLYALIVHDETFELVSCPLERCRSERTLLVSGPWLNESYPTATPLVLSGGWLYWLTANSEPEGIAACPTTGCQQPTFTPTRIRSRLTGDGDGGAYWFEYGASLMRISAGAQTAEIVRDLATEGVAPQDLAVQGDFVYFNDVGYATSSIRRIHKDGTSASELLVTDDVIADFSVNADALYYTSQILTGQIVECSIGDCAGSSATLVGNQRWPEGVQVDGAEAFWLNNQRFSQTPTNATLSHATLLSCVLPDCASVEERVRDFPVEGLRFAYTGPKFAVSRQAVVWLEQFHGIGTSLRRLSR